MTPLFTTLTGAPLTHSFIVGDSIVRKTSRVLNKRDDVVVCLPRAKIEAITERVENIMDLGKG